MQQIHLRNRQDDQAANKSSVDQIREVIEFIEDTLDTYESDKDQLVSLELMESQV